MPTDGVEGRHGARDGAPGRSAVGTPKPGQSVLVVGGGPTGLLLALGLDHVGIPATVIDPQPVEAVRAAPFDGRALALMHGSKRVFDGLGVWPAVEPAAHPIRGVLVRDDATGSSAAYEADEVGPHPFGYGVENRLLRRALLETALRRPGIRLTWPARLQRVERRAGALAATLDGGRTLSASLLVGADGRDSTVRALAGIACQRHAYRQTAIVCAVRHTRPHEDRVREVLRPAGPLALLPIGPGLCSVTWVERAEDAAHLLRAPPDALRVALAERLGDALGEIQLRGTPHGYPLSAQSARRWVAPRLALVGDAAHAVHPIHAQGFNLAVRDVAALVEVLADAWHAARDLGEPEPLLRYERWRRGDASLVLNLTDTLNRLFSNDFGPAKLVRGLGLGALGQVPPLRRAALRRGMGLAGDLPRLARGESL